MMNNTVNNKYKTQMCRHWEQTGNCQLGPRCHFAHGKEELRTQGDSFPTNQSGGGGGGGGWQYQQPMQKNYQSPSQNMSNNTSMPGEMPSNYKTVTCKYFEQAGNCKYGEKCNFAHGTEDLRSPSMPRQPRMDGGGDRGGMGGGFRGGYRGGMGGGRGGMGGGGYRGGMGGGGYGGGMGGGDMGGGRGMGGGGFSGGMSGGGKMNPTINREMLMSNQNYSGQQTKPTISKESTGTTSTTGPLTENDIQNQIAQTQIEYLIQQLESYHRNDQVFASILVTAKKTLFAGNIQTAAATLNEIMQREDKSAEDNENYNSYVANIQQLGAKLYTQYNSQQQQIQQSGGLDDEDSGSPMQMSPSMNYSQPQQQQGGYQQQQQQQQQGGYETNNYWTENNGGGSYSGPQKNVRM